MSTEFRIKLPQFEGPFDLLLFFIERDELDIYDIPIAKITDDFLAFIEQMQELNIEMASDFILMAATLMRIKAKMLLPRKELDAEGNEIDPREDLIQKLIEYKKYKEVVKDLRQNELERSKMFGRGNLQQELQSLAQEALMDAELEPVSVFRLLKAFQKAMEKHEREKNKVIHRIVRFPYTVRAVKSQLVQRISSVKKLDFETLLEDCENRIHAIVTFLSILELLNDHKLRLQQRMGRNNFILEAGPEIDRTEEEW